MKDIEKLAEILRNIKPEKLTHLKLDRVMLHVEPMNDGKLRITYSDGFLKLLNIGEF